MLIGTVVFVNAGVQLAKINSIDDILSFEIIISFMLIGLVPFIIKKIIEKIKKEEKKLVSEQDPPKKAKKIKPDSVHMPDDKLKKVEKIKEDKQNHEKIDNKIKQVKE